MQTDPIAFLKEQLLNVTNGNPGIREPAESQLARLRGQPGFVEALCSIIRSCADKGSSQNWNMAVTACSCMYMNVKEFYNNHTGEVVPREDKLFLCENIIDLITVTQADIRVHKTALCILNFMVSSSQSNLMPFESKVWQNDLQRHICQQLQHAQSKFELVGRLSATLTIVRIGIKQG
jgi:hypothetical protein